MEQPFLHGGVNRHELTASEIVEDMRNLFAKHAWQDREVALSILDGLGTKQSSINWALKTPKEVSHLYSHYYPQDTCQKIQQLLTAHIQIAGDVITQIKARNTEKIQMYTEKWYRNADDFGRFMGSINPYTPGEEGSRLMQDHVRLTYMMVTQMAHGDFDQGITTFERALEESDDLADFLSSGLIKQLI